MILLLIMPVYVHRHYYLYKSIRLPAHLFTRIHRSYIVALSKVTAYTNQDVEIGKIEIPIGRFYSSALKGK